MKGYRSLGIFLLLCLIWGASFLFIKLALQDLGPLTLVGSRLLLAVIFLAPFVARRRDLIPRDRRVWIDLAILGAVGIAIPFSLISWGEQEVESGLASVLIGATPLFAIIVADIMLGDSPITMRKIGMLLVGFVGIMVLMGGELSLASSNDGLIRQAAILLAAFCYASSNAFLRRRLAQLDPVVLAFGQLLTAGLMAWLAAFALEAPLTMLHGGFSSGTLLAVFMLGVLGSGLAYMLYAELIQDWGATRASLVTYLIPVVGVILGWVVLAEAINWRLLVGGGLIVASVMAENLPVVKPVVDSRPN